MADASFQPISDFAATFAEVLGPESHLIVEGELATRAVGLGPLFEWITLGAAMVYLLFGVRYYNYIRYVLLSTLGIKLIERKGIYLSRGEQNNYLWIMVSTGLLLSTLSATKAVATYMPQMLVEGVSALSAYAVLAVAIALFVALIVGGYALLLVVAGFVSEQSQLCRRLLRCKMENLSLAFTLAIPMMVLYLLAATLPPMVALVALALIALFASIISIKDSFFCFKQQKVSILHWFLYLCTLEIFPASLMLAPLLRESCGI